MCNREGAGRLETRRDDGVTHRRWPSPDACLRQGGLADLGDVVPPRRRGLGAVVSGRDCDGRGRCRLTGPRVAGREAAARTARTAWVAVSSKGTEKRKLNVQQDSSESIRLRSAP